MVPMFHKLSTCPVCSGVNWSPASSLSLRLDRLIFAGIGVNLRIAVSAKQNFKPHYRIQKLNVDGYIAIPSEQDRDRDRKSLNCRKPRKEFPIIFSDFANERSDYMHDVLRTASIDVTTLGNLCVDIVLNVPSLPPSSWQEKYAYMTKLAKSSPDERYWEAGGNSNVAITAARLGLRCATLGHVGDEKYGRFLHKILEEEGVQVVRIEGDNRSDMEQEHAMEETLLCWVLVDPEHRHGFCSPFDFNKEPVFSWIEELPGNAEAVIERSKVLFCNGFVFDELSPAVIVSAVEFAHKSGCAVFFDPGPRGKTLSQGSSDQQRTLKKLLSLSDVLLLTADEAEALTGITDPMFSAKEFLDRGQCTKWVVIKMGEKGCLMATAHGLYRVPAFQVDVVDTVGCGDSFAAAVVLGYTQGLRVASTLALANAVGAATAMGCGAGRNVAAIDEVIKLLLSSSLCNECDENKIIEAFSMEHLRTVGITNHASNDSMHSVNGSSLSIPIHMVVNEALNLLQKSSQSQSSLRI